MKSALIKTTFLMLMTAFSAQATPVTYTLKGVYANNVLIAMRTALRDAVSPQHQQGAINYAPKLDSIICRHDADINSYECDFNDPSANKLIQVYKNVARVIYTGMVEARNSSGGSMVSASFGASPEAGSAQCLAESQNSVVVCSFNVGY